VAEPLSSAEPDRLFTVSPTDSASLIQSTLGSATRYLGPHHRRVYELRRSTALPG
jgi:hypothetical protein